MQRASFRSTIVADDNGDFCKADKWRVLGLSRYSRHEKHYRGFAAQCIGQCHALVTPHLQALVPQLASVTSLQTCAAQSQ